MGALPYDVAFDQAPGCLRALREHAHRFGGLDACGLADLVRIPVSYTHLTMKLLSGRSLAVLFS